ncbi:hypothetical protein Hanom_Chr07g00604541 [Helianthus anomalus]
MDTFLNQPPSPSPHRPPPSIIVLNPKLRRTPPPTPSHTSASISITTSPSLVPTTTASPVFSNHTGTTTHHRSPSPSPPVSDISSK